MNANDTAETAYIVSDARGLASTRERPTTALVRGKRLLEGRPVPPALTDMQDDAFDFDHLHQILHEKQYELEMRGLPSTKALLPTSPQSDLRGDDQSLSPQLFRRPSTPAASPRPNTPSPSLNRSPHDAPRPARSESSPKIGALPQCIPVSHGFDQMLQMETKTDDVLLRRLDEAIGCLAGGAGHSPSSSTWCNSKSTSLTQSSSISMADHQHRDDQFGQREVSPQTIIYMMETLHSADAMAERQQADLTVQVQKPQALPQMWNTHGLSDQIEHLIQVHQQRKQQIRVQQRMQSVSKLLAATQQNTTSALISVTQQQARAQTYREPTAPIMDGNLMPSSGIKPRNHSLVDEARVQQYRAVDDVFCGSLNIHGHELKSERAPLTDLKTTHPVLVNKPRSFSQSHPHLSPSMDPAALPPSTPSILRAVDPMALNLASLKAIPNAKVGILFRHTTPKSVFTLIRSPSTWKASFAVLADQRLIIFHTPTPTPTSTPSSHLSITPTSEAYVSEDGMWDLVVKGMASDSEQVWKLRAGDREDMVEWLDALRGSIAEAKHGLEVRGVGRMEPPVGMVRSRSSHNIGRGVGGF
ncbi:hypothetical protein HDU67_005103 [Dinochytrium kinnereticum]|nr:hypothetical protein HDU67_005103 [Dinochytrium kinnereticum]